MNMSLQDYFYVMFRELCLLYRCLDDDFTNDGIDGNSSVWSRTSMYCNLNTVYTSRYLSIYIIQMLEIVI